MRSYFKSVGDSNTSKVARFDKQIKDHLNLGSAGAGYGAQMASLESWQDPAVAAAMAGALETNRASVRSLAASSGLASLESFQEEGNKVVSTSLPVHNWMSNHQLNCAEQAAAFAMEAFHDPVAYHMGSTQSLEAFNTQFANTKVDYVADYTNGARAAVTGVMDSQTALGLEAFEANNLAGAMSHSVAYNFLAPVQEPFVEALFKTIVLGKDQVAFFYEFMIDRFWDGALHLREKWANGVPPQTFKKHTMMDAVRRPKILLQDVLDVVPYLRKDGPNPNTSDFMPEAVMTPTTQNVMGVPVLTQPLVVGKEYSLLEISQHPQLTNNGTLDETDVLDSCLGVKDIFISLDGQDSSDNTIEFSLAGIERANFIKAIQGHSEDMDLKLITTEIGLTSDLLNVKGTQPALVKTITDANYAVRLRVELHGTANIETSYYHLSHGSVRVEYFVKVEERDGKKVVVEKIEDWAKDSTLKGYAETLKDAKVKWFRPLAYITNRNIRRQGIMVDSDVYTAKFAIGVKSPVRLQRPVGSERNYPTVEKLVSMTRARQTADAFYELWRYRDMLRTYCSSELLDRDRIPNFIGIGKALVKPHYDHITYDLRDHIKSGETKDNLENARCGLVSVLQEAAARCMVESQWMIASTMLNGGKQEKPHFVIGTGQYLPLLLSVKGDLRLLGENFDHTVVTSMNEDMDNKIIMTLTRPGVEGFDPLSFGHTFYYPELVTTLSPHNVNGVMKETVMVTPRYQATINLPILIEMDVLGVKEFMTTYNHYRVKVEGDVTTRQG